MCTNKDAVGDVAADVGAPRPLNPREGVYAGSPEDI